MMRMTLSPAILPASLVAWRCESLKYAGTVITASVTVSPKRASTSALIFWSIIAEISSGRYSLAPILTSMPPFEDFETSNGTDLMSCWTCASS